MSAGDAQQAQDVGQALTQHGGWVMAAAMTAWGGTLRFLLGRQVRANDETSERLGKIETRIARIEGHLGVRRDPWDDSE